MIFEALFLFKGAIKIYLRKNDKISVNNKKGMFIISKNIVLQYFKMFEGV